MSEGPSDRVRVRRGPKKARYDWASIAAVLDDGLVGHIAFVEADDLYCIPMLYARIGEELFIHGSSASRAVRTLAAGVPACLTVTIVHGLVLARSAFEHSANYESVVAFGRFRALEEGEERLRALEAFTNKLIPGRWSEVRRPNTAELKATAILALTIEEASLKRRSGPPDDDDSADAASPIWAGVVPISTSFATPVPAPGLRPGVPLAASVGRLLRRRGAVEA